MTGQWLLAGNEHVTKLFLPEHFKSSGSDLHHKRRVHHGEGSLLFFFFFDLFLSVLLKFCGVALVLLTDLVELLHVLAEVRAALQSDEKFGFLGVSLVVRGLHRDGLSSDFLEGCVVVPA